VPLPILGTLGAPAVTIACAVLVVVATPSVNGGHAPAAATPVSAACVRVATARRLGVVAIAAIASANVTFLGAAGSSAIAPPAASMQRSTERRGKATLGI